MGRGESQRGPLLERDVACPGGAGPGLADGLVEEGARRAEPGLGLGEGRLGRGALGECPGRALRLLPAGQRHQIGDRRTGDAERHGADAERKEPEDREDVERSSLHRPVGHERHRAGHWHAELPHLHVARAGAA